MEDNYNFSIPKWVDANYPITFIYDDAHVNVLDWTLLIQIDHKSRGIERERRNLECKSYNFEDFTRLVPTRCKIYVFYKVRRHVSIECPQVDSEMKDEFVRHVGQ